jgi:hypothetical protein
MILRKIVLASAAILALTLPATAADISRTIAVDNKFQPLPLEFKGVATGRYFGLWTVRRVDGILEMCGIGVASDPAISKVLAARQSQARLSYNGKVVLKDISFFTAVNSAAELKTGKANCVSTGANASGSSAEVALTFVK